MNSAKASSKRGVLAGCDERHEWLLSWWWLHFRTHNRHPVTFIDFGMTPRALAWCAERGEIMKIEKGSVCSKENLDGKTVQCWEEVYGSKAIWHARDCWFMKPNALAASPYLQSIWLDLDCEILRPLDDLFEACEHPSGMALTREPEHTRQMEIAKGGALPDEQIYNTGVIAFKKESPLVIEWAKQSYLQSEKFWSDQHLLSRIIHTDKIEVGDLPLEYNWRMTWGLNINASIIHWVGDQGKQMIRRFGGFHELSKGL